MILNTGGIIIRLRSQATGASQVMTSRFVSIILSSTRIVPKSFYVIKSVGRVMIIIFDLSPNPNKIPEQSGALIRFFPSSKVSHQGLSLPALQLPRACNGHVTSSRASAWHVTRVQRSLTTVWQTEILLRLIDEFKTMCSICGFYSS